MKVEFAAVLLVLSPHTRRISSVSLEVGRLARARVTFTTIWPRHRTNSERR